MTKRCKNCGWPNDDGNVKCEKCGAPLFFDDSSSSNLQSSRPSFQQTVSESSMSNEHLRRTISENQFFGKEEPRMEITHNVDERDERVSRKEEFTCPNCGYPAREGATICHNCGTPLVSSKSSGNTENSKKCKNCGCLNNAEAKFCNQCGEELDRDIKGNSPQFVPNAHGGTVNPWSQPENGCFCTLKPIAWIGEDVVYQPQSFTGQSVVLNRANTDPNNQSITSSEQAELSFENGEWYIVDKSSQHTTYVLAAQKIKLHKGDIIVLGNRLFEFN